MSHQIISIFKFTFTIHVYEPNISHLLKLEIGQNILSKHLKRDY